MALAFLASLAALPLAVQLLAAVEAGAVLAAVEASRLGQLPVAVDLVQRSSPSTWWGVELAEEGVEAVAIVAGLDVLLSGGST